MGSKEVEQKSAVEEEVDFLLANRLDELRERSVSSWESIRRNEGSWVADDSVEEAKDRGDSIEGEDEVESGIEGEEHPKSKGSRTKTDFLSKGRTARARYGGK